MFTSLVQLLWRKTGFPRAENLNSSCMWVCLSDLRLTDDDYFYLCDRNLLDVLSRRCWILTSWGGEPQPAHPSVWASASLSALYFRLSGQIILIWAVRRSIFTSRAYSSLCRYLYTWFVCLSLEKWNNNSCTALYSTEHKNLVKSALAIILLPETRSVWEYKCHWKLVKVSSITFKDYLKIPLNRHCAETKYMSTGKSLFLLHLSFIR